MHLITCKKTCCTTTTRRSSRRRPRRLVPQSPSFTPSTAHPQITVYSSSVRQKISLLRRSRRKKGGEERRAEGGGERYGSATDKLAGYPTDSSITHDGAERRKDGGRTHGINPGHGYVMLLPPSLRLSVRRHYGGGSVLLITQIGVNCGLGRNDAAPPPCLAYSGIFPKWYFLSSRCSCIIYSGHIDGSEEDGTLKKRHHTLGVGELSL